MLDQLLEPTFSTLATILIALLSAMIAIILARYRAKASRLEKLLELDYEVYTLLGAKANQVRRSLWPTPGKVLTEEEFAAIRANLDDMHDHLHFLVGEKAAVLAYKGFHDSALDLMGALKRSQPFAIGIPNDIAQLGIRHGHAVTEFHIKLRQAIKNPAEI